MASWLGACALAAIGPPWAGAVAGEPGVAPPAAAAGRQSEAGGVGLSIAEDDPVPAGLRGPSQATPYLLLVRIDRLQRPSLRRAMRRMSA